MWIEYDPSDLATHPKYGQDVVYFFDRVGVHVGKYGGDWLFYSDKGFLTGDVTHWMPYTGQDTADLAVKEKDFVWKLKSS